MGCRMSKVVENSLNVRQHAIFLRAQKDKVLATKLE